MGKATFKSRTRILMGDGRGHFLEESVKRLPFEKDPVTNAIAVGDVDGDGDLDAFVANFGRFSNEPDRLLINDGKGKFVDRGAQRLPQIRGGRSQIVSDTAHFADLDGDGDLDLVYINDVGGLGPLVIYWNDGKGKFSFAFGHVPALPALGWGLEVGDIDGDKDLDLIYGGWVGGIHVLVNDGKGKFTDGSKTRISRTGWLESIPVLGDVDGDGDLDLVVGKQGVSPDKRPGQTALYLNDGKGVFTEVTSSRLPKDDEDTTALYVRDLDLDGDADILVVNQAFAGQKTRFYANDGKGKFTDRTTAMLPAGTLTDCANIGIGDFDGDGDLDLIAAPLGRAPATRPINDILVWNLTRHLYAPSASGAAYALDVWGEPGQYALLFVGLKTKRLLLSGFGVLELDLTQSLLWPGGLWIPKTRKSRWVLPLPAWMKGKKLYSQALLYDPKQPTRSHLTNAFEDLIR